MEISTSVPTAHVHMSHLEAVNPLHSLEGKVACAFLRGYTTQKWSIHVCLSSFLKFLFQSSPLRKIILLLSFLYGGSCRARPSSCACLGHNVVGSSSPGWTTYYWFYNSAPPPNIIKRLPVLGVCWKLLKLVLQGIWETLMWEQKNVCWLDKVF